MLCVCVCVCVCACVLSGKALKLSATSFLCKKQDLPSSYDDISAFRQVPDHQEVSLYFYSKRYTERAPCVTNKRVHVLLLNERDMQRCLRL
jgi:hypothetical protein